MGTRIVRAVSVAVEKDNELHEYAQGDTIDLSAEDEARLEEQEALVPEGYGSFEEFHADATDIYRGGRGDTLANARVNARLAEARSGGIVDVSALGIGGASATPDLAAHISESHLTVDDTVALAEDDPSKAQQVLEAEHIATGGDPRKGVQEALQKIIDGE